MRAVIVAFALTLVASGLAACGGGSSTPSPTVPTASPAPSAAPTATASPTAAPTATATPTAAPATTLATATLLGSPGFVAPSGRTVYVLSNDLATSVACTVGSGCTGVWPIVVAPPGVALSTGFTTLVRADAGVTQLVYNNHPLYTYAGDTANAQTNGNGIVSFGGTWTVARP